MHGVMRSGSRRTGVASRARSRSHHPVRAYPAQLRRAVGASCRALLRGTRTVKKWLRRGLVALVFVAVDIAALVAFALPK